MADYVLLVHKLGMGNWQITLEIGRLFELLPAASDPGADPHDQDPTGAHAADGMGKRSTLRCR